MTDDGKAWVDVLIPPTSDKPVLAGVSLHTNLNRWTVPFGVLPDFMYVDRRTWEIEILASLGPIHFNVWVRPNYRVRR